MRSRGFTYNKNIMPKKIKSLLYLSCFVIAATFYYKTDYTNATPSKNDEMVDTYNTHIDEISILSFDDNEVEGK